MKKVLTLIFAAVFSISCTVSSDGNYEKLAGEQFISLYDNSKASSILVDVRTADEFSNGAILDAINIDYYSDDFTEQLSKLDTTKTAFIYCKSGGRSGQSAQYFFQVGFKKVVDLKGGYSNFKK